jgi:hypothetical protein
MAEAYIARRHNGEYIRTWPTMAEAEKHAAHHEGRMALSSRTHRVTVIDHYTYVVPLSWHPDVPLPYKPGSLKLFAQHSDDTWQCLNCGATTDDEPDLVDVQVKHQLDRVTWKVSANVKEVCTQCGAHEIYIDPTWSEDQS